MKRKCSMCDVWMLSSCARKITNKLYDYAVEKKIKIDESSSFICQRCYHKLYEPNDAVTEEAVAGPSRIAAAGTLFENSCDSSLNFNSFLLTTNLNSSFLQSFFRVHRSNQH